MYNNYYERDNTTSPTGFLTAGRGNPAYRALLLLRAGDVERHPGPEPPTPTPERRGGRRRRPGRRRRGRAGDPDQKVLRVMQFNCNGLSSRLTELKRNIAKVRPHAILLQETMLTPMQPVPRIPGYNVAARQDHDQSVPPGPATAGQSPVRGVERVADPPRTDTAPGRPVDTGPTQTPSERVRRTSDPRTWACRSRYQGDRTRWCGGCRAHRKCTTRRNVTPDQPPDSPESPEPPAPPAPPVLTPLGPPSRVSPSRSSPPTPTPASDLTTTATPELPLLSPNLTDLPRRTHRRQSAMLVPTVTPTRATATPEPPPLTPQGTPSRLRRSPATSDGEEPPQLTPHHHQAGPPPPPARRRNPELAPGGAEDAALRPRRPHR